MSSNDVLNESPPADADVRCVDSKNSTSVVAVDEAGDVRTISVRIFGVWATSGVDGTSGL